MIDQSTQNPANDIKQADAGSTIQAWGLGVVGAVIGAVIGWFAFGWLASQGFYALAIPGALVGLGFGTFSRRPTVAGGVFCALFALTLMILCEWHNFPWVDDESLGFFLSNLHNLTPTTMLFMGLGTIFAFWFGRGR